MRTTILTLLLAALVAIPGVARGEQVRLKSGEYLQGQILGDRCDEEQLTIRLYRTGGVFEIPWSRLIAEDEDRIREDLGLKPVDIEEIPRVKGHEVRLVSGDIVFGLVENPGESSGPVKMRTATGEREYPRSVVAAVESAMVEALEVYSPEELAEMYRAEFQPESPSDHVELGDRLMQITAYEAAKEEYDAAMEDGEFAKSERAQIVRNRLARVEILLKAKDATDRVHEIKRLAFQDRFDEALDGIAQLEADYAENPAILRELKLERLRRSVRDDRRKHFLSEVRREFHRAMGSLAAKRVRDKDATITEVLQWAQNSRGLGQDIFAEIAERTGLEEAEAREFWDQRDSKQVHRYSFKSGTFMNRDVADHVRKALAAARSAQGRNNQRGNNRGNNRNRPQGKAETPTTPEEWWESSSPSEKESFVKAWFAEYAGVMEVLRFDRRVCSNCAGRGVTISVDANSGEEVRHICPVCNLAGQERVVVAR